MLNIFRLTLAIVVAHVPSLGHADEPEIELNTTYEYYDITWDELPAWQEELEWRSIQTDSSFWGEVKYDLVWDDTCDVRVDIDVKLPKLVDFDELSEDRQGKWLNFYLVVEQYYQVPINQIIYGAFLISQSDCMSDGEALLGVLDTHLVQRVGFTDKGMLYGLRWERD